MNDSKSFLNDTSDIFFCAGQKVKLYQKIETYVDVVVPTKISTLLLR